MSLFKKIGVAVAVSALASGTVLSGAAISRAQPVGLTPVFTSPSSASVSGRGVESTVTYTNRSGQGLVCGVLVGPGRLLGDRYDEVRSSDGEGIPEYLSAELTLAMEQGRVGILSVVVENGETAVSVAEPGEPGAQAVLTDSSFAPAALATCSNLEFDTEYDEVELSPGAGVPSGLGSLDAALTALESSGSVAETTGSLGS